MNLYDDIKFIKGVGPKFEEKLNKCGIYNVLDMLLYFPRDYQYISGNVDVSEINEEEKIILSCKVVRINKPFRTRTGKTMTEVDFTYANHNITAIWFNNPYIIKNFVLGNIYNLMGKFKLKGSKFEVISPQVTCNESVEKEIIPIYPLKGDLTNKSLYKILSYAIENVKIIDNMPDNIINKYNLCSLEQAVKEIHFPSSNNLLQAAIIRLKFQELFNYSMKLLLLKKRLKTNGNGIQYSISNELSILKEKLPFELTEAQNKVVREILLDAKKKAPMNRLVQGDVGSGKTIVAIIAMFNAYKNGYQVAMMAPTEILAKQHYVEIKSVLKDFDIDVELLTGSTSAKEKVRIKEKIATGKPLIAVGTHALIQKDVEFSRLGLAITDEQHRFGVEQRSKLTNSTDKADVLVMTATPIPRTLALYLYSDLDVSIIDQLPPGRKAIKTELYRESNRNAAYDFVLEEIEKGRQAYIVCPLIEDLEENKLNSVESLYEELSASIFKGYKVEMMHGKLKAKEKNDIIDRFKNNDIQVLISTTVIEVGVNVPNASCMVIENAERFGLAQLHQLRGRVGRGQYQSYCILIANIKSKITEKRMNIMTESTDGFYISEQDFKLRGTGEMFGFKQSGDSGLLLADFVEDINMLKCAYNEAKLLINSEDGKIKELCVSIEKSLVKSSKFICFN